MDSDLNRHKSHGSASARMVANHTDMPCLFVLVSRPPRLSPPIVLNDTVAGHLLVLRGDLTRLMCSAVLIPTDTNWELVTSHWGELVPLDQFEKSFYGHRLTQSEGNRRYIDLKPHGGRQIRLVATADERNLDAQWVVSGVVEAITDFACELSSVEGRIKPLVALPIVGTGAGGFRRRRGTLISALLPGLQKVAHDTDVDVALVLYHERDHAAVQNLRPQTDWDEFTPDELAIADELGRRAANRELSLFLGSGISVPLGLPDWKGLLTELKGEPLADYSPADAPKIAQDIADKIGVDQLHAAVADRTAISDVSPAHLLLAGLGVRQNITTNYDLAYESALASSLGDDGFQTLPRELAIESQPWLLKLHGDARRPESIILTTEDYARLESDYRSVVSVVKHSC